ncbi:MAG: pimeloyl-ACP methyl ester carboxylesterase [Myxococcota bacterium]|jgi:pimeloyl-ACP methyl ester carboxylesterase
MLLLSLLACVRTPNDLPDAFALPDSLSAYDAWLEDAESRYDDIVPGAERMIRWDNPEQPTKTAVSLVYFHGFSATRQEIAPVCEDLAASLGANTYFTRLSGHGRSDDAMAEAQLRDWLVEAEEALAIGRALGEEVIIVGTSTGATLGAWLASRHDDLAANIFLSPNFGPQAAGSRMLLMPGRGLLSRLIIGEYREWEPGNALHGKYWTTRYPTVALFPMMELVRLVEKTDLSENRQPTLVIYSPNDQVIRPDLVEERMAEMGGQPVESVQIAHGGMDSDHVLAGDIVSPDNNALVIATIADFLVTHTAAERR